MNDIDNGVQLNREGAELVQHVGQSPGMNSSGGSYVPVFSGEITPLPKVKNLTTDERKSLDSKLRIYPDATIDPPVYWEMGKMEVVKLVGVIAVVAWMMWGFFPWDIFQSQPPKEGEITVQTHDPVKADLKQYHEDPEGMLPHKRARVHLYLLMQGNANEACTAGDAYWTNKANIHSPDWEPVWEIYLSALNVCQRKDQLSQIAPVLYASYSDNVAISMQYARIELHVFETRYLSIKGREDKKKNSQAVVELRALLDQVIRICSVASYNIHGTLKDEDLNADLPELIKARAHFYQWKLIGDDRWNSTESFEKSVFFAKSTHSADAQRLREDIANFCDEVWGSPWLWNREIAGKQYRRETLKKYILTEERK
jgi:hypothetical protein